MTAIETLRHRRIALAFPLFVAASLLACSSPQGAGDAEDLGQAAEPIIKGKASDASQDTVVLLVHYDPAEPGIASCSGTFLAPNLILTARHCVADTDESAACDVNGKPLAEGAVRGNHDPKTLYVFKGQNFPKFESGKVTPDGVGAKILDDGGTNLCNHDIALLLLQDPVKDAPIAKIRLDSPVVKGETFTAVGWGVTDSTTTPAVRQQRTGIKVQSVGPDATTGLPVPPNEFQVGESICSGDSGGPALATSTGAIVGIVSRGGNNTQPNQSDPSTSCTGANAENLYTKVASFKDFIMNGYTLAGAEPWLEDGPDPRLAKNGDECNEPDGSECRSNVCLPDPTGAHVLACVQSCADDSSVCDEGTTCVSEQDLAGNAVQVCRSADAIAAKKRTTTTTTGCATTPGTGSSNGMLGFVLAAFGLVTLRRRRR